MKTNLLTLLALLSVITTQNAFSYNEIIRPYHSVRAAGMGDVRYTTGLFEENFYANPARATENPENLFQLPKISAEVGTNTLGTISDITKSGSGLSGFAKDVGKPVSQRFQLVFPGFYKKNFWTDKWTMGIGMLISEQFVVGVHQNATIDPMLLVSAGPAITVARRLLEEDRLSIGATLHAEYRLSSNSGFAMKDFLTGTSLSDSIHGGSGLGFNLDLGTTFRPHWTFLDFQYEVGAALNNVMGGYGKQFSISRASSFKKDPIGTPHTFNFGCSAIRKTLPGFDSYSLAVEFTDIGNQNGSFYKTLHIGTEEKWKAFAVRLGLNQGYFTAGAGMNLGFFDLNLATYGEELGMNAGTIQDRRYAAEFGFQI